MAFSKILKPEYITVFLIIVFIGLGTVFYTLDYNFKNRAEEMGNKIFQAEVKIKDANISYISDTIKMQDVTIYNPAGFPHAPAIHINEIRISANNLTSRPVKIKNILLRGVDFYAERNRDNQYNLVTLMASAETRTGLLLTLAMNDLTVRDVNLHLNGKTPVMPLTAMMGTLRTNQLQTKDLAGVITYAGDYYGYEILQALLKRNFQNIVNSSRQAAALLMDELQKFTRAMENALQDAARGNKNQRP